MLQMIRKPVLVLMLTLAGMLPSVASPLTPQRKQEVLATIGKAVSELRSMQCGFVQTKHMSMLADRMVSHGTMHYLRPDKLRWEYTQPYTYLFLFNGTKVYVGNKNRNNVMDTASNKLFREIAGIMMSTVTGKALTDPESFSLDVEETGKEWRVTLVPKKKEMKRMFRQVMLVFHRTDASIAGVEIYEKNGDKTIISMSDVSRNADVDETCFAIPL